jgi:hypothetical protein
MVTCPFCQYGNEDGAIFCEQCKSDLGTEASAGNPSSALPAAQVPFAAVIEEPLATAPLEVVPVEDLPFALLGQATPATEPPVAEIVSPSPAVAQGVDTPRSPERLPADAQPCLVVLRGQKINVEYPLYEGHNFIGRTDERPVDIDLEEQEPPDRIWSSRQHAVITYQDGQLIIEDLNSSNGTFVNRSRIYPGQKRPLKANDIIQIGTVQMKLRV